jgi:HEAT repeat protein
MSATASRFTPGGKPLAASLPGASGSPVYRRSVDVPSLLKELQSSDWTVAAHAAERLRYAPGEAVTRALAEALDAHNTAITDAAAESLILRNESRTVDLMWQALATLDDDVTDQIWSVIGSLPDQPVSQELERQYRAQP